MEEIVAETGLTHAMVQRILSEDLRLSKKSVHWVPHLLLEEMKAKRKELSGGFC